VLPAAGHRPARQTHPPRIARQQRRPAACSPDHRSHEASHDVSRQHVGGRRRPRRRASVCQRKTPHCLHRLVR